VCGSDILIERFCTSEIYILVANYVRSLNLYEAHVLIKNFWLVFICTSLGRRSNKANSIALKYRSLASSISMEICNRVDSVVKGDGMLTIVRGLPGSGKSTYAKTLNGIVLSADDFWFDEDGIYKYTVRHARNAHEWIIYKCREQMELGANHIIIDNTNIHNESVHCYIGLAVMYNYIVRYTIPNTEWAFDIEECSKKNIHSVPYAQIRKMCFQWCGSKMYKGGFSYVM
jgi:predicted kinase